MEGNLPAEPGSGMQTGPSPFAALLREFRSLAQLTQEELAARSSVSVRAISDLERGVKIRPQRATVQLLADGLGLTDEQRLALESAVPSRNRPPDRTGHSLDLPVGGFLGSVPDGPLVARASEIGRIRTVVETVSDGAGRLLLLIGEPGVGKTRLAQAGTLICRANGMHLVAGQCYESQQSVAFYPFLGIISRLAATARTRLGTDPLQRWPQLQRLIPDISVSPVLGSPALDGEGNQQRLFWAVTGLLESLARIMPLALALDDLHWADQSSLELLQHLAHHLRNAPVLLLGTYRDLEVGRRHPLRRVLRDLHRDHLSEEISVGRMNREGTEALMVATLGGQEVSPGFVALVHRHTEGNAFFVQEVVRTLVERGDAFQQAGVWDCRTVDDIAIPRTVHDAIGERLSRLSDRTQSILSEASVLGDKFTFDDLQAMCDRSEEEIEHALEEAARASVVRFGEAESCTFYHALTQRVLYRELSPRRRKRLHVAAGNALEQEPERIRDQRAAELAWHFIKGGVGSRALHYAILAGDQAGDRFAHREAERHFRVALDLARDNEDIPLEALLLEKIGWVLTNAGKYEEARGTLEQAGPLYRQVADQEGEVRVTVQLGSVHRAMGSSETAIGSVQALLDRLDPDGRPQDIAELNIVLETLCYTTGRYQDGLRAAEHAAQLSRQTGDFAALARAETGRGSELIALGRLEEGIEVLEAAIAIPVAADDPYNLSRALENAADGHCSRGNMMRSRELAARSMAVAERIDSPWDTATALKSAGMTYHLLGDWERARVYLEQGDKLRRSLSPSWWAIYGILELSSLCLDEGDLDWATKLAQEGLSIAHHSGHLEGTRTAERLLAELDLLQGRPEAARNRLEPLLDRPGLEELQVTEMLPTLAAAYAASGDMSQAMCMIEDAIRRARATNDLLALTSALVLRGRLMTTHGHWAAAERDLEEAVRLARDIPYPHLEGQGLFEWGALYKSKGESDKARMQFDAALAIFRRLGARPFIDRTHQALSTLQPS